MKPRVAVIGGGWAGCAAGLSLAEAGIEVTLFESSSTLGGRARAIQLNGQTLDNGQHILLGAYSQTLALIAQVNQHQGQSPEAGLLRLPLVLDRPPDFYLACQKLPAPFHLLVGLLRARGLTFNDKLSAARWAYRALKPTGLDFDTPLGDQIAHQPERVRTCLWQPLCVSALNTEPELASAKVFKQVLAAAFGKSRRHSDMLLPSTDLTRLFPQPAVERIAKLGGHVHLRNRVQTIRADAHKVMLTDRYGVSNYDRVILAVAPQQIPKLCAEVKELEDIVRVVETYHYGPIATAYVQYPRAVRLARPMLSLSNGPAQFVFDRGHTHGQAGFLAFVVSAASDLVGHSQSEWIPKVEKQLSHFVKLPAPLWHKGVLEKQATYTCTPNMPRPQNATSHPLIFLAGDYTAGVYPATLESATQSGVKSALAIINSL